MDVQFISLNSGSNGNCYYVGNSIDAVLVDVGIACREVEKRMKAHGLSMQSIKAIFVSHEHGDHIKGVSTLANKYKIPVYITDATKKNGPILINHLSKKFVADTPITIGSITVTAFTKQHDAIDPHSFIITQNNITVGVFTDIGIVCQNVIRYFKQCHAIFLEANYDEAMLLNGHYPTHLKNRIKDGQGHLSNKQAFELYVQHKPTFMSHVILAHLSKENNTPEIAKKLFNQANHHTTITVAPRYAATEIFTIKNSLTKRDIVSFKNSTLQLSLF